MAVFVSAARVQWQTNTKNTNLTFSCPLPSRPPQTHKCNWHPFGICATHVTVRLVLRCCKTAGRLPAVYSAQRGGAAQPLRLLTHCQSHRVPPAASLHRDTVHLLSFPADAPQEHFCRSTGNTLPRVFRLKLHACTYRGRPQICPLIENSAANQHIFKQKYYLYLFKCRFFLPLTAPWPFSTQWCAVGF